MTHPTKPFPCPFCQSGRVVLVGGGLVFLHYRCGECSEVWTAMAVAPRIQKPPAKEPSELPAYVRGEKPGKIWLN